MEHEIPTIFRTKEVIHKTSIRPGQNAWHYPKMMNKMWMWFRRKYLLSKIYGPLWDWGIWRSIYNFELYKLYKQPKLIPAVKISGIRWDGHEQCVEEKQMDNRLLMQKISVKWKGGRSKSRCLDEVNGDARKLGIRMWWKRVLVREGWRKLLLEVKAFHLP
jgi:hypothetical protein